MCSLRKFRRQSSPRLAPASVVRTIGTTTKNRLQCSAPTNLEPEFDPWLMRELAALYSETLYEPLPPALAKLAKELEVALCSSGAQNRPNS